jgi:hypothetical protein
MIKELYSVYCTVYVFLTHVKNNNSAGEEKPAETQKIFLTG